MITLGIAQPPRPEIRSDATATLIDALTTAAAGSAVRTWAAGAVEIAASHWARALSTATVAPAGLPIGPAWLAEVGRDLARHGEAVYLLDVQPAGRLRLLRATATYVSGASGDPADWWYRLELHAPQTTRTITAPADQVVHLRYATERYAPARGMSPLAYAAYTGTLTAALEQSLGYEAGGAVAQLIALPEGYQGQAADDSAANPIALLLDAIRTARGRTLLPETTAGSYGDTGAAPPRRDWKPERLGADPPMGMVTLRKEVESTVLGCFGIPAPLGPSGLNDGTAIRESVRRLWSLTVQPLDFARQSGLADVAARARAVSALVDKAGIPVDGQDAS